MSKQNAATIVHKTSQKSNETKQKISNSLKGRSLSAQHKEAISNANLGRKLSNESKQTLVERLCNNHPKAYEWILIDPHGKLYRTKKISAFCIEHSLSYSAIRQKGQTKDSRPISSGPSKGWSVYGVISAARLKEMAKHLD